ncbi:MAG: hypothetical protein A2169_07895 [Deltaproteobacteria bacterium RBG_13_47_9]|nr:MAG: hypothetical protein A2169_07895 [Deltaproteobacteria bacterium RBG_13_47_9]
MKRNLVWVFVSLVLLIFLPGHLGAAAPFYEGQTVRIIVGYTPGGGYDLYARTIARHIGRHLPGKPTVIVENMPGAGSLISANYLFRAAKPDGLTIGHFNGGLFFSQVMGMPGIEFDARKFEYIGTATTGGTVALLTKATGINTLEKWLLSKRPLKLGGVVVGAYAPDNVIRIVKEALSLPIHHVSGFKGIADIRMAVEGGDLDGSFGAWYGVRVSWRKVIESGDILIPMQAVAKPFPDLPNVPLAINLAKTEDARQIIKAGVHLPAVFAWPFVLPPATPKERVQTVREAFQDTLKDSEFLSEVEKAKMGIDAVSGEELEKIVHEVFKTDPAVLNRLKSITLK